MELYFITHNQHKFKEAADIGKEYNLKVKWYNYEYEELQKDTLEIVAKNSCKRILEEKTELSKYRFFLEDAGLFIESLNGFPGPFSSYVFKTIGNDGILQLMKDKENRSAYFQSVVAFYSQEKIRIFKGTTKGNITYSKLGDKGFGFDPIFQPLELEETFAQMTLKTKNLYSHRQKSVRELFTSITAFR